MRLLLLPLLLTTTVTTALTTTATTTTASITATMTTAHDHLGSVLVPVGLPKTLPPQGQPAVLPSPPCLLSGSPGEPSEILFKVAGRSQRSSIRTVATTVVSHRRSFDRNRQDPRDRALQQKSDQNPDFGESSPKHFRNLSNN